MTNEEDKEKTWQYIRNSGLPGLFDIDDDRKDYTLQWKAQIFFEDCAYISDQFPDYCWRMTKDDCDGRYIGEYIKVLCKIDGTPLITDLQPIEYSNCNIPTNYSVRIKTITAPFINGHSASLHSGTELKQKHIGHLYTLTEKNDIACKIQGYTTFDLQGHLTSDILMTNGVFLYEHLNPGVRRSRVVDDILDILD